MRRHPDANPLGGHSITRRGLLRGVAGLGALALIPGCGDFPAEEGAAYAPWRFPGDEPEPERIAISAAILAANPHNTQPWRFHLRPGEIELWADPEKSLGPMDPLGREMWIGLGCALENLTLAARAHGLRVEVTYTPDPDASELAARVRYEAASPKVDPLYEAITQRHTNRGEYADAPAPRALVEGLEALVDGAVTSTWIPRDAAAFAELRRATIEATEAIVDDHEMNEASHRWWRQTEEDIRAHRDGLTLDATGLGSTKRFFGKISPAPDADTAGEYWLENTKGHQTTGSGFVMLSTPELREPAQHLEVGRVYQRMHLWLSSHGWAAQPLNQAAERRDRELELGLEPRFGDALAALAEGHAQMIFRVGQPWDRALKSPRRPIDWVLEEA